MKKVFVAGGGGYVGSKLVPALLALGYRVSVYDLFLYGDHLPDHEALTKVRGDIRDIKSVYQAMEGSFAIIHLACISNDPSFELNPELGKSINYDAFEPLVIAAKHLGVSRFLYASSSSVYGIKKTSSVDETLSLEPLTDYSKYKAACEELLLQYQDDLICTILRPATVCGYAPRQRLDVVVNILTNLAYHKGEIQVMGGSQMRPNIHIDDMVDAYLTLLEAPKEKVAGEIFNVGYHNHTVLEIGEIVQRVVKKSTLKVVPTNDERSYHVSSEKIKEKVGFEAKRTIEEAVESLLEAFEKNLLPNALEDKRYFNLKTMSELELT